MYPLPFLPPPSLPSFPPPALPPPPPPSLCMKPRVEYTAKFCRLRLYVGVRTVFRDSHVAEYQYTKYKLATCQILHTRASGGAHCALAELLRGCPMAESPHIPSSYFPKVLASHLSMQYNPAHQGFRWSYTAALQGDCR